MAIGPFRNSQGYALGCNRQPLGAGPGNVVLTGTSQIPCLLEDLIISGDTGDFGEVQSITVAGQQIMASNQNFPVGGFNAAAQTEGYRSISLSVSQQQQVTVTVAHTNAAALAGNYQFAISTTPIDENQVIPTSQAGSALSYCFGMGTVIVPAGATIQAQATALRPCILGRMIAVQLGAPGTGGNLNQILLDSLLINNIEMLTGPPAQAPGAAVVGGSVPGEWLSPLCTDTSGLQVAYPVELNSTVIATWRNTSGAPIAVCSGFFLLPNVAAAG